MPTKTKTTIKPKPARPTKSPAAAASRPAHPLSAWLWRAPAKFAILSLLLFIAVMAALTLVSALFTAGAEQVIIMPLYVQYLFLAAFLFIPIFSIYKLVRWTPSGALDRHSFVGLSVVTSLLSVLWLVLAFLFLRFGLGDIPPQFFVYRLLYISPTLFFAATFVALLVMLYVLGIYLSAKLVAQYWRARAMGIPTWKFLCSFPFGWGLLFYPQIFLPEEKPAARVISVRPKWLASLFDWTAAKTINALLLITILPLAALAVLMPSLGMLSLGAVSIPVVIFFGLWAIIGAKKLNAAMPGWFSSLTIILNVIAIAAYVLVKSMHPELLEPNYNLTPDQIQVTEVAE
ncbi:MAG: hypothetical protein FWC61_03800 [Proteobacteria bacterium]|nr:hypothetical protein [Pseudomonadota bacterium]